MRRFGQVIGIDPVQIEKYREYHGAVWPEVLGMIKECNICNYSIFLKENMLFAYFEYNGSDFDSDMAKMAAHPVTREWWSVMEPMQRPLNSRKAGEWWAVMEEVFHLK